MIVPVFEELTAAMLEPDVATYRAMPAREHPDWLRYPTSFRHFVVALLVEIPTASATYDEHGFLTGVEGVKLKVKP